jgi:hypothetical protein
MDKEIIELIKGLAGNAETVVIWYMALDVAKVVIGWLGALGMAYVILRGIKAISG